MAKNYYCPVLDDTCPYLSHIGTCELGADAYEECDDYAYYNEECDEDDV